MSTSIVNPGRFQIVYVQGKDLSNTVQSLGSLSATVDDYTTAYVVKYPDAVSFALVVKVTPAAGASIPVNVTLHGTDLKGNALPAITQAFTIQGPPAAPLAVSVNLAGISDEAVGSQPADPGTPTAVLI